MRYVYKEVVENRGFAEGGSLLFGAWRDPLRKIATTIRRCCCCRFDGFA